jgi:hypothetical protein
VPPAVASAAASRLSSVHINANESKHSATAKSTASRGRMRPAATGRLAVRAPIMRSMSRSSTWLKALAPPHAKQPPTVSASRPVTLGAPAEAAVIAHSAVSTSSDITRGFVSVR